MVPSKLHHRLWLALLVVLLTGALSVRAMAGEQVRAAQFKSLVAKYDAEAKLWTGEAVFLRFHVALSAMA
jgi:hypothetical protein